MVKWSSQALDGHWPTLTALDSRLTVIDLHNTGFTACVEPSCHILEFWLSPTLMNSKHLQSHLWSCLATRSLCQGSGYGLLHYYGQFIYIFVFCNSCTPVTPTLSTMNSLSSVITLCSLWTSFITCSLVYLLIYSLTLV